MYAEGTHIMIPWFEWPVIYDVRAKPKNIPSLTGSKGLPAPSPPCSLASHFQLLIVCACVCFFTTSLLPDLQMVNITLRVLSRPDVNKLPHIFRTLGEDFDERVLPSIVNEVLKAVVAQFNAGQLITQRDRASFLCFLPFFFLFTLPEDLFPAIVTGQQAYS